MVYAGLVFDWEAVELGQRVNAWVTFVRPDGKRKTARMPAQRHPASTHGLCTSSGKIDATLAAPVSESTLKDAGARVLAHLAQNGGELAVGDKSDPEDIKRALQMSKSSFKAAVGGLLRQGLVTVEASRVQAVAPVPVVDAAAGAGAEEGSAGSPWDGGSSDRERARRVVLAR